MSNEDGLNGSPWYIAFLMRVGLPTAFAVVLLWYLLTNVTKVALETQANTMQLLANQARFEQNHSQNQLQMIQLLVDHTKLLDSNVALTTAMCINLARDEQGRARCVEALRK